MDPTDLFRYTRTGACVLKCAGGSVAVDTAKSYTDRSTVSPAHVLGVYDLCTSTSGIALYLCVQSNSRLQMPQPMFLIRCVQKILVNWGVRIHEFTSADDAGGQAMIWWFIPLSERGQYNIFLKLNVSTSSNYPLVYEKDTKLFVWNCVLHSTSDVVFDCCAHAYIEVGWGGRRDCQVERALLPSQCRLWRDAYGNGRAKLSSIVAAPALCLLTSGLEEGFAVPVGEEIGCLHRGTSEPLHERFPAKTLLANALVVLSSTTEDGETEFRISVGLCKLDAACLRMCGLLVALAVQNVTKDVPGVRVKRFTCDVLSVNTPIGSLNHAGCAVHCLTMGRGYRGGRCRDGVCHCRKLDYHNGSKWEYFYRLDAHNSGKWEYFSRIDDHNGGKWEYFPLLDAHNSGNLEYFSRIDDHNGIPLLAEMEAVRSEVAEVRRLPEQGRDAARSLHPQEEGLKDHREGYLPNEQFMGSLTRSVDSPPSSQPASTPVISWRRFLLLLAPRPQTDTNTGPAASCSTQTLAISTTGTTHLPIVVYVDEMILPDLPDQGLGLLQEFVIQRPILCDVQPRQWAGCFSSPQGVPQQLGILNLVSSSLAARAPLADVTLSPSAATTLISWGLRRCTLLGAGRLGGPKGYSPNLIGSSHICLGTSSKAPPTDCIAAITLRNLEGCSSSFSSLSFLEEVMESALLTSLVVFAILISPKLGLRGGLIFVGGIKFATESDSVLAGGFGLVTTLFFGSGEVGVQLSRLSGGGVLLLGVLLLYFLVVSLRGVTPFTGTLFARSVTSRE
uniref:Invertebrate defensins family profile domain-containing protein n=1 Tax=Timema shepardi TaxID=629360 RepID=A0A7R9AXW7_TIMSH|nr:unnamed protein product [Timema shepardi]